MRHSALEGDEQLLTQLEAVSVSTVRRLLANISRDKPRPTAHHRSAKHELLRDIPIRRIPWDIREPGHFEADLVHHCGPTTAGKYLYSLQMVDVATGWVETCALLGRSYRVMEDAFSYIFRRLPFAVRELHPNNGSEFFNAHLLLPGLIISRSRPYHKNDNPCVEERNHFLIRSWIGYQRLDTR